MPKIGAAAGVSKHTELTDREVAGVIDHAASSVTDSRLTSGVGLADGQIAKLPVSTINQFLRRGASAWQLCNLESVADHIIYKDASGYCALRTEDGIITHSHATDGAACINALLASLTLCHNPSSPNLYVRDTNPTGFKEGRTVRIIVPELIIAQTLVIPPNQDFIFDADRIVIYGDFAGDEVRIDSSMNSRINLGIVNGVTQSPLVRVKPQTVGPDNQTVFTTSHLNIEALVSAAGSDGLMLDSDLAHILDGNVININEINLSGTGTKAGVTFFDDATNVIRNTRINIERVNQNTTTILLLNANHKNQRNRIEIRGAGTIANMVISDQSIESDMNTIITHPPSRVKVQLMTAITNFPASAWTTVAFDTVIQDSFAEWDATNKRVVFKQNGFYDVQAGIYMITTAVTGARGVLLIDAAIGKHLSFFYDPAPNGNDWAHSTELKDYFFKVGDYLYVQAWNGSGAVATIQNNVDHHYTFLIVRKVR